MALGLGGWRAKLALTVGVTTVGLSIAALAGEAAMRYRERHRRSVPGTMPLLFYRHVRLRHALVRDTDYFGWVHVNRAGFRGPDVALEKAPGVVRIMIVGSSTTFDGNVRGGDQATWPARLEFWLKQMAPDRTFEVINAGVPGYGIRDELIRLETELLPYAPDLIVLYEGHNDLFGALRRANEETPPETRTPSEMPVVTPWNHWLTRHSLVYVKLVERWRAMKFHRLRPRAVETSQAKATPSPSALDDGIQEFTRDVTSFVVVARSFGIPVVIPELVQISGVGAVDEPDPAVQRMWAQSVPFATPRTFFQGYLRYNAALQSLSARYSVPFVKTRAFGLKGATFYSDGDPIHFNDRGADRMGHEMAAALLAIPALALAPSRDRAPGRPAFPTQAGVGRAVAPSCCSHATPQP